MKRIAWLLFAVPALCIAQVPISADDLAIYDDTMQARAQP